MRSFAVAAEASAADLQRAGAFLQAFLQRAPTAMTSPTLFICVVSAGVDLQEFLEPKARNLRDDAINGTLGVQRDPPSAMDEVHACLNCELTSPPALPQRGSRCCEMESRA